MGERRSLTVGDSFVVLHETGRLVQSGQNAMLRGRIDEMMLDLGRVTIHTGPGEVRIDLDGETDAWELVVRSAQLSDVSLQRTGSRSYEVLARDVELTGHGEEPALHLIRREGQTVLVAASGNARIVGAPPRVEWDLLGNRVAPSDLDATVTLERMHWHATDRWTDGRAAIVVPLDLEPTEKPDGLAGLVASATRVRAPPRVYLHLDLRVEGGRLIPEESSVRTLDERGAPAVLEHPLLSVCEIRIDGDGQLIASDSQRSVNLTMVLLRRTRVPLELRELLALFRK